jgi:hypothetical protein
MTTDVRKLSNPSYNNETRFVRPTTDCSSYFVTSSISNPTSLSLSRRSSYFASRPFLGITAPPRYPTKPVPRPKRFSFPYTSNHTLNPCSRPHASISCLHRSTSPSAIFLLFFQCPLAETLHGQHKYACNSIAHFSSSVCAVSIA